MLCRCSRTRCGNGLCDVGDGLFTLESTWCAFYLFLVAAFHVFVEATGLQV